MKSALALTPTDIIHDKDLAILTETFLVDNWQHTGFYNIHLLAKKGERGRPMGGISILLKPWMTPTEQIIRQENSMLVATPNINIIAAYFQPYANAVEIIDEIGTLLKQCDNNKPAIIGGDFNCRLDVGNYKTKLVIRTLEEEGFVLLNNPQIPTYICHNGKSTIDIALIRGDIKGNILPIWNDSITPIRKHIPMKISLKTTPTNPTPPRKILQSAQRKIDREKIKNKRKHIIQIEAQIEKGNLEEATGAIEDLLKSATMQTNQTTRKAKRWFDSECYSKRNIVLNTLHRLRRNVRDAELMKLYTEERKSYKKMIKEKKKEYLEREAKREADKATKDPFIALRPRKQAQTQNISMKEWEDHFSKILNKQGIQTPPKEEKQPQTTTEENTGEHLQEEDIKKAIKILKKEKAAGPDNIHNEHIKDTTDFLQHIWTKLFNKCLAVGRIPTQWRHSIIKVLYKGTGDPKDTNKYRGIALENTQFKIFSKIIADKIKDCIDSHLPEPQMGFRSGRSTMTAVQLLLNNIDEALKEKLMFYTVFIDFTKAFDLLQRDLIIQKLEETLGKESVWTRIIKSILKYNIITISDNLSISDPIMQSNGVLQGDPMSPMLYILATEEVLRITEKEEGVHIYAYADDIVVGSTDIHKLQETIGKIDEWCTKHELHINIPKTEMMIFRNGGKAPAAAEISIRGQKLKISPDFKYLGITLQPTAKCFTKHVTDRAAQAVMAMHDIKNIRLLSLETALNLFKARIIPILCYGIEVIWSHLTENNLNTLEKVKATYLKRALGVSKTTRSRLVYLLAREPFLLEDIKLRYMLQHTKALGNQMKIMEEKRADVWPEFYGTGAMTDRTWTTSNFELRHVVTRLSIHGFHHLLCTNKTHHDPTPACVCELCSKVCERYHIELCTKRLRSIRDYANVN